MKSLIESDAREIGTHLQWEIDKIREAVRNADNDAEGNRILIQKMPNTASLESAKSAFEQRSRGLGYVLAANLEYASSCIGTVTGE